MEVRDPIHGFIEYDEDERKIVDCPAFQRLRLIRQLALAHYVYPSANHTRFEHSLGVMHVAGLMADQLGLTPNQKKVVRLAGLVHDIGHGPFCHVSEEAFNAVGKNPEKNQHKFHESITKRIIQSPRHLLNYLGKNGDLVIKALFSEKDARGVESEIVSGPIDADKIDYLTRDSYFSGAKYGIFDVDKLIRSLVKRKYGEKEEFLILLEGIQCLEQYIVAKNFISLQVYRHRIRLITDSMLVRGIELGFEIDGYIRDLYNYDPDSEEYLDKYLASSDARLIEEGISCKSAEAKDIFQRLRERRLYKSVFKCIANEIKNPLATRIILTGISKPILKILESKIAEIYNVPSHFCILNFYKSKFDPGEASDFGSVLVLGADKVPIELHDCSDLCNRSDTKLPHLRFEVYIPCDTEKAVDAARKPEKRELVLKLLEDHTAYKED